MNRSEMSCIAVHVGAGYFSEANVEKAKVLCRDSCQKVRPEISSTSCRLRPVMSH